MFITDKDINHFNPYNKSPQIIRFRQLLMKRTFMIQAPSNYESSCEYPLVIALHGWTEQKDSFFRPWEEVDKNSQYYPCFYLAPNNTTKGWDIQAHWVRKLIDLLIRMYPVDKKRIYIIGFSMGGSGSFAFAESLYNEYGITVAAIVRCAGKSRPVLPEPLFSQTALWYNAGSQDSQEGVYETFSNSKNFYRDNTETFRTESSLKLYYEDREISRETVTLNENEGKRNKYLFSIYSPMDHEFEPVFILDDIQKWLFKQSLDS